ncbi:hypothetical protein D9C73_015687 [Collichthys lucidus]|uniref:Uncharacterized protein n=1 Tax=Collichthys lucidus TaxID=240159 RepID=A0A4V6AQR8_COLLU|nr:hypothetical protein D9C73_015687 [Collichthys lucidus]
MDWLRVVCNSEHFDEWSDLATAVLIIQEFVELVMEKRIAEQRAEPFQCQSPHTHPAVVMYAEPAERAKTNGTVRALTWAESEEMKQLCRRNSEFAKESSAFTKPILPGMDTLDFLEEMFGDLVKEESPHIFNKSQGSSAAAVQMLSLSSVIYNIHGYCKELASAVDSVTFRRSQCWTNLSIEARREAVIRALILYLVQLYKWLTVWTSKLLSELKRDPDPVLRTENHKADGLRGSTA